MSELNGCRPVYKQGWNDERKLLIKIAEVMKQVQYIQKRGKNKFHNYNYATEADVNEKIRTEIAERNVIMIPGVINHTMRETTTRNGNTEYIQCVDMEFTFMDGETGECLVVPMSGEGQDNGDKAMYKAISGVQKYALMKTFMIPTGDDPEGDEGVDERTQGNTQGKTPKQVGEEKVHQLQEQQKQRQSGKDTAFNVRGQIFQLQRELGWSFDDLSDFASDALNRKIKHFKTDVNDVGELVKLQDLMLQTKENTDKDPFDDLIDEFESAGAK